MWMMQSFYNFRIQNGFPMVEFKELGFSNTKGHFGVTFSRLAFQNDLINLGKTNMTSHSELNLLTLHKRQAIEKNGRQPKSPHKIFLYDTSQLNDKNEERQAHFLKGLGNFLGLTQELPPAIHFVPGKKPRSSEEQKARDAKKINICDEKHIKRRQKIILKIGRDAQEWILNYFLASPDVMVSNPDHFRKVVESYQFDPCPGNETIVLHNKTSYA